MLCRPQWAAILLVGTILLQQVKEGEGVLTAVHHQQMASGTLEVPQGGIDSGSRELTSPKSCQVTNVTSTSLWLTWSTRLTQGQLVSYNVTWTYQVLWSEEEGGNSTTTSTTDLTFSGLIPYTTYNFTITPYTTYTSIVIPYTSTEAVTPMGDDQPFTCFNVTLQDVPGLVEVMGINTDISSATFSWVPPDQANGVILQYELTLYHDGPVIIQTYDGDIHNGTVTGLLPCHWYTEYMSASTIAGWGPSSSTISFDLADNMPPVSVECAADLWTLTVCWVPIVEDCPPSQYTITWTSDVLWSNDSAFGTIYVDGNITCYFQDGLIPYTNYNVSVTVGSSPGPFCSAQTQPGVSSPPTNLTVMERTQTALSVNWSLPETPNGKLEEWHLTCSKADNVVEEVTLQVPDLTYTFHNLTPATTYSIEIEATTAFGTGMSARVEGTTLPPDNEDLGLIVGLSVLGGLVLVLAGMTFYFTTKKQRKEAETPITLTPDQGVQGSDNEGVEVQDTH